MERRVILSRLLDKYESSKHLLQPGVSPRRVMLRIDRKELPEYKYDEGSAIRDAYNIAAISLEKDGLVSVEWARPGRMSVIALSLPSLDEAYRRCGRQTAPDGPPGPPASHNRPSCYSGTAHTLSGIPACHTSPSTPSPERSANLHARVQHRLLSGQQNL